MWCDAMCAYLFCFYFIFGFRIPYHHCWKFAILILLLFRFKNVYEPVLLLYNDMNFSAIFPVQIHFSRSFVHFIIKFVTIYVYSVHTVCYFNNFSCLTISDDKVIRQHATNKISSYSNEERKWKVQCLQLQKRWQNKRIDIFDL